ncbi:hypothetical protein KPHES19104_09790 [Corynebacterium ulcerans]
MLRKISQNVVGITRFLCKKLVLFGAGYYPTTQEPVNVLREENDVNVDDSRLSGNGERRKAYPSICPLTG